MIKPSDIEKIVTRFKIDLLKTMPFYGDVVTKLIFISDTHIRTACTDGLCIKYNPNFLATKETISEINFILLHEVFHVMLLHCTRAGGRNKKLWNVACDLIVNKMLNDLSRSIKLNGIKFALDMPKDALYSFLIQGETVESVYAEQMAANQKLRLPGSRTVTVVLKKGWGAPNTQDVDAPDDLQPSAKQKKDHTVSEDAPTDAHNDASLPPNYPEMDADESIEEHIKGIIGAAMQKSRSLGASYYIPEAFASLVPSKNLNWKNMLKQLLSWQISDEASYATPERKYLHMDLILPGHCMNDGDVEELWAFVDSSGSVGQNELNQFLTQLYHIVKEFHCVLHICYWDTSVTDVYKNIRREQDVLKSIPKHSGGTDINCVYKWLRENRVRPNVLLVLSDGYWGRLSPEYQNRALQKNTIVVLSTPSLSKSEHIKTVGKIATL